MSSLSMTSTRLSAMMFLQYLIYGSWFPMLGLILSKAGLGSVIGITYAMAGLAGILSPIFAGMIVDRFFASEKVMAAIHTISAVTLYFIPAQIENGNSGMLLFLLFAHGLLYKPTLALVNSISFHHVKDSAKSYPLIRVFGTIGFLVAGLVIGFIGFSGDPSVFKFAAGISLVLALYSLTLPHTPAPAKGKPFSIRDLLLLDAFSLLKDRNFLIFIVCSTILYIPIQSYFSYLSVYLGAKGFENIASIMTIGQVSEIIFMLFVTVCLKRFGFKYMLIFGVLAWVLRLSIFGFSATSSAASLIIIGIALHGLGWDFFFTTGEIYTDKKVDEKIRGQAQSLLKVCTLGVGSFFSSILLGKLYNQTITAQGAEALPQWQVFWLYPAAVGLVIALAFFFFFKEEFRSSSSQKPKVSEFESTISEVAEEK